MPERKRNTACPFLKRDGSKCGKMVANSFCSAHAKSQQAKFASSQAAAAPAPEPEPKKPAPPADTRAFSATLDSLPDAQKAKLLKLLSDV